MFSSSSNERRTICNNAHESTVRDISRNERFPSGFVRSFWIYLWAYPCVECFRWARRGQEIRRNIRRSADYWALMAWKTSHFRPWSLWRLRRLLPIQIRPRLMRSRYPQRIGCPLWPQSKLKREKKNLNKPWFSKRSGKFSFIHLHHIRDFPYFNTESKTGKFCIGPVIAGNRIDQCQQRRSISKVESTASYTVYCKCETKLSWHLNIKVICSSYKTNINP